MSERASPHADEVAERERKASCSYTQSVLFEVEQDRGKRCPHSESTARNRQSTEIRPKANLREGEVHFSGLLRPGPPSRGLGLTNQMEVARKILSENGGQARL